MLGHASHASGELELQHASYESPDSFRLQGISLTVHTKRNATAQIYFVGLKWISI